MAQENDRQWHQLSAAEALSQLDATASGLNTEEVRRRHDRFGPSVLRPPKVRSAWARLFAQFHNVLIYVLLAAGIVTLLLGHVVDASVIVAVVAINAVIAFGYYGRVMREMWMNDAPESDGSRFVVTPALTAAIVLTIVATVALGIYPEWAGRFGDISSTLALR